MERMLRFGTALLIPLMFAAALLAVATTLPPLPPEPPAGEEPVAPLDAVEAGTPERRVYMAEFPLPYLFAGHGVDVPEMKETLLQVLPDAPGNYTGILLELTLRDRVLLGDGAMAFKVYTRDGLLNVTTSRDEHGVWTLQVHPHEYAEGALLVRVHAAGDPLDPNLVLARQVRVYATVFTGGPPQWDASSVPRNAL